MSAIWAIAKLLIKEIFRKKDFYVALILIVAILFYASQMQFFNVGNITRYLLEIGLALIFFFSSFLTLSLAARQYPSETQNRTCPVLMAKPLSRWQFVAGKFLGSLIAGWAAFVIFLAVFLGMAVLKGGHFSAGVAIETAYLFLMNLLVLAAMASGLSYYLTTAANVTTSVIVYLLMNTYGAALKDSAQSLTWASRSLAEVFYYLLPHFEFFDIRQRFIHEWGPLPVTLFPILTAYAVLYALIFLFAGWLKFRRQNL